MIRPNGDLVPNIHGILTIHGVRVLNLRGIQARALKVRERVESLDGGLWMMITGQVMDGTQRAASRLTTPITVQKVARSLTRITRGPSHRHIPSPSTLGNPIPSQEHPNQDPVVEVERSPKSGKWKVDLRVEVGSLCPP